MKEHILAKLTNDLRDIAVNYHDHQSLRQMISNRLYQALHDDFEWSKSIQEHKPSGPNDLPLKLRKD